MADCYNCDTLGDYNSTLESCGNRRTAGTSDIVLILCGNELADPSDGTEVNALIDASGAKLLSNLRASIAPPTPITADPIVACGSPVVINNDWTVTITDFKVDVTNNNFWQQLTAGYQVAAMIMRICSTDGLDDIALYINAQISFGGGLNSPDTNAELIRNEITATFRTLSIETITAPTGVWD